MSLLLNNLIINDFIEEEIENDTSLVIDYCNIERGLLDKRILFLDVFDKKKDDLSSVNLKKLHNFFFKKNYVISTDKKKSIVDNNDRFIMYIIVIAFFRKNLTIHATDVKGLLKVFCSTTSSLKLSLKRQRVEPKIITKLIKYFLKKLYFNDEVDRVPVALHLKNVNKSYFNLVVKKLKTKFDIKIINFLNCSPHNGCRPRKIRRVKQRKRKK